MIQRNDFMNLDRFNCKTITENTVCFSDCFIWILLNRLHDIIHWLDIVNQSFYRLFIIDERKIPLKILIMSYGWIIIINLILIDRSYLIILFMINNTIEINGIQYDYKTDEYCGWIIMNQYRKLTKYTPQNRSVDSTAYLF